MSSENQSTPGDEDLVKACAAGDRGAFLALYDRFAPRVFGLLLKVIGDRTEAEDVLQEVMWEAWTRAERYNGALGSVATWLLMIARSRGIDAVRRRHGVTRSMGPLPDGAAAPMVADGKDRAFGGAGGDGISHGIDPVLREALASLPPEQQTVIVMAFFRGLTREQIGESLGIPIGTVKTRIRLGVRKLAEQGTRLGSAFE